MSKRPFLSVIIPSYNEQKNFGRGVLDGVMKYLSTQKYDWEVLLSDDGSTDGTVEALENFARKYAKTATGSVRVIKNIHAGKGPTVQSGMLAASGEWRLFTDFDQSTPLSEVEKLFTHAKQGYDVVIGSREGSGSKREKEPIYRHLMGRAFNFFVQALAIPGILDTQCGFKLFSAAATEKLFGQMFVYGKHEARPDAFTGAFDVEVLFLARKYRYRICEIPIEWQHNETDRVSAVKDSLRMLRDIVKVRLADMQGKYPR